MYLVRLKRVFSMKKRSGGYSYTPDSTAS